MSNNQLNVSLDLSGPQGSKRIGVGDNTGQNAFGINPAPSTLAWNLTGALANAANFVPMTDPNPGFQWAYPPGQPGGPPLGVFENPPPAISNGGNTLTLTDNHFNAASVGQWIYILRVLYNGSVYATVFSPNEVEDCDDGNPVYPDTIKNPVIINR